MSWIQRLKDATTVVLSPTRERAAVRLTAHADAAAAAPRPGRVLVPRRDDTIRDYPSSGLTPSRLMSILREADAGSPSAAVQLYEEMEEKDPHLYSVARTRRLALTGLDWDVVSAADVHARADRKAADAAAGYCRDALADIETFDQALEHLSLVLGRNISMCELVWEGGGRSSGLRLVDVTPVDFGRLVFDDLDRPRILTEDAPRDGIEPSAGKFVVHAPYAPSGHAMRGGLLRVTAMAYVAKNLALKDWMIFSEVFGMPVRIARYEPSASEDEKREMLNMLQSLGSNAAGIFSRAVELQIIDANRGTTGPPYPGLVEFLNREMSKAWLGQTLTTEVTGQSGTLAASAVHAAVREDLRLDDIRKEGQTIRRDILAPLARFQFGPDVPAPYFRRKAGRARDLQELADVLDVAVNRLGVQVPRRWAHDALGVPVAGEGEPVLAGAPD